MQRKKTMIYSHAKKAHLHGKPKSAFLPPLYTDAGAANNNHRSKATFLYCMRAAFKRGAYKYYKKYIIY